MYSLPIAEPIHDHSEYRLAHIYQHGSGARNYRYHRRLDVTPQLLADYKARVRSQVSQEDDLVLLARTLTVHKSVEKRTITRLLHRHVPNFIELYLNFAAYTPNKQILRLIHLEWASEDEDVPDVSDKETIMSLAVMLLNAYVRLPDNDKKQRSDWVNLGDDWDADPRNDVDFGWDENGVRGHVFVNHNQLSIILAIKGTSGAVLPGGGSEETAAGDKLNDNLLFSCCCARVGYTWTTVCDCYSKTYTCNQDCLERELMRPDRYYQAVLEVYRNVTMHYPGVPVWVTGHLLGGALALLLARTYGLPAVVFEAPGEMLATRRLHLPMPPGFAPHMEHIWHIGHTADPIYMGVCNGALSSCNAGGYAMETACHTGLQCVYDVVNDLGWRVNLLNHRIRTVIDGVISVYNQTPECVPQPPCRDCFNWRFISDDDDVPDPPLIPNPLKPPHTTRHREGIPLTKSLDNNPDTSLPEPPSDQERCLERNWLGWCTKWGDDDLQGATL